MNTPNINVIDTVNGFTLTASPRVSKVSPSLAIRKLRGETDVRNHAAKLRKEIRFNSEANSLE